MEIYVFLVVAIGIISLVSALYIKNATLEDCSSILVVKTCNCAVICEGVLRDVIRIMEKPGRSELIVLDKGSSDGTYEILKKLSTKYAFSVTQVYNEQEVKEIVGLYGTAKNYKFLVMDENTQYFTAKAQLN